MLDVFTDVKENGDVLLNMSVYPNPALEKAYIASKDNSIINKVEIINYLGVTVLTLDNVNSDKISVNVKDLPSGIYYIKVNGNNFINVLPLSINK